MTSSTASAPSSLARTAERYRGQAATEIRCLAGTLAARDLQATHQILVPVVEQPDPGARDAQRLAGQPHRLAEETGGLARVQLLAQRFAQRRRVQPQLEGQLPVPAQPPTVVRFALPRPLQLSLQQRISRRHAITRPTIG